MWRAHVVDQRGDVLASLHLGARQVLDLEPVEPGHVRAVAPDDAGQRRLQPPVRPRAADRLLGLLVAIGEGVRLLELEALGGIGVDAAQAEHRGHDVAAVDERRAGRRRDVEIAGRVDDDVAQDRLASRLRLADHALDRGRPRPARRENHECSRSSTPSSSTHLERDALPAVGIERRGEADRMRRLVAVEIERAPARPACGSFRAARPIRARAETSPASSFASRSIIVMQMPRTEISRGGCPTCRRAPAPCRPTRARRDGCSARAAST